MTPTYSAAVKLADLDDFLSPAQSCILPLLDDKNRNKNVADGPHDSSAPAVLPSADAAADAALRATVSNPSRHDRTRKIERHAEKRRLAPSVLASSARGTSSSAADRDGFGRSGRAAAPSGTTPERFLSPRSSSNSNSSTSFSASARSSKLSATASNECSSSAFDERPSLIKLGQSRFSKRQDIDTQFLQLPAAASGSSSSRSSSVAFPSSSAFVPSSSGTAPALPGSFPRGGAAAAARAPAAASEREKQVARIALYDCLACKGCVTSSEAVLVERHSVDEFLRRTGVAGRCGFAAPERGGNFAAEGPKLPAESPLVVADAAAAAGEAARAAGREKQERAAAAVSAVALAAVPEEEAVAIAAAGEDGGAAPRLVVVSVSPQSLAALAQHFHMQSAAATLRKLSSLFRLAGATHVLHTAVGDAISVLEVEREFIDKCRKAGIGRGGDAAPAGTREDAIATSGAWDGAAGATGCMLSGNSAEYRRGSAVPTPPAALAPVAGEKATAYEGAAPAAVAGRRGATSELVGGQRRGREVTAAAPHEEYSKRGAAGASSCSSDAGSNSLDSSSSRSGSRTVESAGPAVELPNSPFALSDAQQQQNVHQEEQRQIQQQEQNKQQPEEKHRQDQDKQRRENFLVTRTSARRAANSYCDLPMLASFCPGFVCYAETSYDAPLLLQHMSRVRSGQQIQGLLVKGLLLELHNAAAFLLRYAATAPALPGAGISPLLLQLLLRRSAYASPSCWKTAQPLETAVGGGRDAVESVYLSSAAAVHQCSAAASPSALRQRRAADSVVAAKAGAALQEVEEEEHRETQQLQVQGLKQPAVTTQVCWRRPAPAGVNDSVKLGKSVFGLSYGGGCLSAAEEVRPEDVFHVCVMPCFDKKLEAARPEFRRPLGRSTAAIAGASAPVAAPRGGTAVLSPNAAAAVSTVGADAAAAPGAGEGEEASPIAAAAAERSVGEESAAAALTDRSHIGTTSSGTSEDVTAADVDLVLATNEVLALLQRMQVQFHDLPESRVNTLLDDFFPLRSRVSVAVVPGGLAPATPRDAITTAVAVAPRMAAPLGRGQDSAVHNSLSSGSSMSDAAAPSCLGVLKQIAPSACFCAEGFRGILSCFAMAVPLLSPLRSLVLSPYRLLYAAVMSPYMSTSWCWSWCCCRGRGRLLENAAATAAAISALSLQFCSCCCRGRVVCFVAPAAARACSYGSSAFGGAARKKSSLCTAACLRSSGSYVASLMLAASAIWLPPAYLLSICVCAGECSRECSDSGTSDVLCSTMETGFLTVTGAPMLFLRTVDVRETWSLNSALREMCRCATAAKGQDASNKPLASYNSSSECSASPCCSVSSSAAADPLTCRGGKDMNRSSIDGSGESNCNGRGSNSGDREGGTTSDGTTSSRRSLLSQRIGSSRRRQRETPSTPASLGREQGFLRRAMAAIVQHEVHQRQTQQQRQQYLSGSCSGEYRSVGAGERACAHEKHVSASDCLCCSAAEGSNSESRGSVSVAAASEPAGSRTLTPCCGVAAAGDPAAPGFPSVAGQSECLDVHADARTCLRKADSGNDFFAAVGGDGGSCRRGAGTAGESCCNGDDASAAASSCFISSEQVCGSGGYAERLFRRAAEELFGVRVEGPVPFQKRKGGNEGFKEAVLVVDGEEKLRVALAYGFNNIQKVIQKMKRQRQLTMQLARATPAAAVSTASSAAPDGAGPATSRTVFNAEAGGGAAGVAVEVHQQRERGDSDTTPQRHGQSQPAQQQHQQEYRGCHDQQQQPQQQGKRAIRPLPHFVEFAACPGGCLCGGGQRLEDPKKNTSGSSSEAAIAPHVCPDGPSFSSATDTMEKKEKNDEQLQERQQQLVQKNKNYAVSEPSSNHKASALRDGTTVVSEKSVGRSASIDTAAVSSAARAMYVGATEEARAGDGSRQSQSLAGLTKLLHQSHVYCDPLQRVEVQLAYLYLLNYAEHANHERQGQSVVREEANGLQRRQQEQPQEDLQSLQQRQHQPLSQHKDHAEQHTQSPVLPAQAKTQPQQQQKDESEQQQLQQQEEQDQHQRREQQQDHVQQQHDPRRAGREGYLCDESGEMRKEATSRGEEFHTCRLCLSAADEGPTGRKPGGTEEGIYDYCVVPYGEEARGSASYPSTRTGTSDGAAVETVAGTSEGTGKAAETTKAAAETSAAQAQETPEAAARLGWWDAFGENKAAVKLLRTRFREIWMGNTGTVQPQKSSAAATEQSFSARSGYRAVGAKPSLHW